MPSSQEPQDLEPTGEEPTPGPVESASAAPAGSGGSGGTGDAGGTKPDGSSDTNPGPSDTNSAGADANPVSFGTNPGPSDMNSAGADANSASSGTNQRAVKEGDGDDKAPVVTKWEKFKANMDDLSNWRNIGKNLNDAKFNDKVKDVYDATQDALEALLQMLIMLIRMLLSLFRAMGSLIKAIFRKNPAQAKAMIKALKDASRDISKKLKNNIEGLNSLLGKAEGGQLDVSDLSPEELTLLEEQGIKPDKEGKVSADQLQQAIERCEEAQAALDVAQEELDEVEAEVDAALEVTAEAKAEAKENHVDPVTPESANESEENVQAQETLDAAAQAEAAAAPEGPRPNGPESPNDGYLEIQVTPPVNAPTQDGPKGHSYLAPTPVGSPPASGQEPGVTASASAPARPSPDAPINSQSNDPVAANGVPPQSRLGTNSHSQENPAAAVAAAAANAQHSYLAPTPVGAPQNSAGEPRGPAASAAAPAAPPRPSPSLNKSQSNEAPGSGSSRPENSRNEAFRLEARGAEGMLNPADRDSLGLNSASNHKYEPQLDPQVRAALAEVSAHVAKYLNPADKAAIGLDRGNGMGGSDSPPLNTNTIAYDESQIKRQEEAKKAQEAKKAKNGEGDLESTNRAVQIERKYFNKP